MEKVTVKDIRRNFSLKWCDERKLPKTVTYEDSPVAVILSPSQYNRLVKNYGATSVRDIDLEYKEPEIEV